MKPEILEKSICSTCSEVERCILYRSKSEPVVYCEEFNSTLTIGIKKLVEGLIAKHNSLLIAILEEVQKYYNYLPENVLREVSSQLKIPMIEIYGVASFYKAFSLKPRGKHLISACLGTACHVRGAKSVIAEFERQLSVKPGETTPDKEFTFETVNCLGACALGPIVVVDGEYYPGVRKNQIKKIVEKTRAGSEILDIMKDDRIFPIEVSCSHCNHTLMKTEHLIDNFPCIHVTVSYGGIHGWYRLSSLYGSYNFQSEHDIPLDTELHIFCPHCHSEMTGGSVCPECRTIMVPMIVRGGGTVQICTRRGCKGHLLDI